MNAHRLLGVDYVAGDRNLNSGAERARDSMAMALHPGGFGRVLT